MWLSRSSTLKRILGARRGKVLGGSQKKLEKQDLESLGGGGGGGGEFEAAQIEKETGTDQETIILKKGNRRVRLLSPGRKKKAEREGEAVSKGRYRGRS